MKLKSKFRIIILAIYVVALLLSVFLAYKSNDYSKLNSENSIAIPVSSFSNGFVSHRIEEDEVGIQRYEVQFNSSELDNLGINTYKLFINRLVDNAYRVYLNGVVIDEEGDMNKGRSRMKNNPNIITFDRQLLQEENILIVETYATYKSGIEATSVYITDNIIGLELKRDLLFYGNKMILMGIGFLLFSALFMVFIYYASNQKESAFIYCTFATIFFVIYFFDYVKNPYLSFDYLVYKKIFMCSLYIGSGFYIMAISKFLNSKYLKYITFATIFGFVMQSLQIESLVVYKQVYGYWFIALLMNIILWFIYGIINMKKNEQVFIIVTGFFFLNIYASFAIIIDIMGGYFTINSPIVYIFVLAMLPLLLGFEEIFVKEEQIRYEKQQRENEFVNSITDDLTGAWNQRYIYMKLNDKLVNNIVTMIDIDDFKEINDTYGHLGGDYILQEISRIVFNNKEYEDEFCRSGGDEFVLILHANTDDEAYRLMEKIRKEIDDKIFEYNEQKIKVTISIGIYSGCEGQTLEKALESVDKGLYVSKEMGKNTVSVVNG